MAANGQRNDSYALEALNLAREHQRLGVKTLRQRYKAEVYSLSVIIIV